VSAFSIAVSSTFKYKKHQKIMESNKRNTGDSLQATILVKDSSPVKYRHTASGKYSYSSNELRVSKAIEESLKIGRRYSFDDNGGGYQGL
jgi:hypothetical protein